MKRIMIIATLVVFTQIVAGFSMPAPQTFPKATTLRRIEVNAKTITAQEDVLVGAGPGAPGGHVKAGVEVNTKTNTALTTGKNYIVDLTQRGVVYEFSPQAGQIDLSRVKVRTARGEVAIGSFLETTFLKDKFAGFKYKSQAFSLATLPTGTVRNPPTVTSNFACGRLSCYCSGKADCIDLIFNSSNCGGSILCFKDSNGESYCTCLRLAG